MADSAVSKNKIITIDPDLVENYVMHWATFGGFGEGGVCRTVYSPEWVGAQDQYAAWCEEAGLSVKRDAVGSVWGVLQGTDGGKVIASGSHVDSQTRGGRYDGALGALSALIALKALKARYGMPKRTLECVSLCEEESSRFPATAYWGSRAITSRISPTDPDTIKSWDGQSIGEAMREVGLDPARIPEAKRDDIDSFVELHIEQGPILEQVDKPVAIVTGITGIRHYLVEIEGEQNHAGALPMDMRHDAMAGFLEMGNGLINTAHRYGRPAVTTIGRAVPEPNFPPVIPGKVTFTLDARHPDPALCKRLYEDHERLMLEVAARRGLKISWSFINDHPPCPSDPALFATFKAAAEAQGIPYHIMHSGAGHDSQQMGRIAKVVMIFVRSKDGRSHTPDEFSSVEDIVAGIETLAAGFYKLAYQ